MDNNAGTESEYKNNDSYFSNNNYFVFDTNGRNNNEYVNESRIDFDSPNNHSPTIDSFNSRNLNKTYIYRYKFSLEFMDEIYQFSKIHQYDERKYFKEAWELWVKNNEILVNNEINRLKCLKYEGDILDKMFKSARYYFRKKGTVKKAPVDRKKYVGVQKKLLDAMDEHIKINVNSTYKPSDGFINFCKENVELLKDEIKIFIDEDIDDDAYSIKKKVKKTYKNRYFMFISNSKEVVVKN